MVTYMMSEKGLAINSAGIPLPIPQASIPSVAVLFLTENETVEIRPRNGDFKYTAHDAYGVTAGRWRRLPIMVAHK